MADQVLIVDEDRRLSAMLAEYLTGYGFRVLTADTGGGIADIARQYPPSRNSRCQTGQSTAGRMWAVARFPPVGNLLLSV